MAQWKMTDAANGMPTYANNILNVAGPSTGLYGNTTAEAFVANVAVGVFGVSADEMNSANASSEATGVAHAGWTLRTEGTGGRAGRVQYEVLVAAGSMTGDGADDTQLPE
jgi:hypothetical protein